MGLSILETNVLIDAIVGLLYTKLFAIPETEMVVDRLRAWTTEFRIYVA